MKATFIMSGLVSVSKQIWTAKLFHSWTPQAVFYDKPKSSCMAPLKFQLGAPAQLYLPRGLLIHPPCPAAHGKARTSEHSLRQNGQDHLDPLRINKAFKKRNSTTYVI